MTVTVCIPAYRAENFIAETVGAVLAQTHRDLKVVVSIDPPAEGSPDRTASALEPLLRDSRLSVRLNPIRLGWAENTNAMTPDIATPFYCFLPHDDIWSPRYLETMLDVLKSRPDAILAYGDLLRFGDSPPARKSVSLPPAASRRDAILSFLLHGTNAMMWRGVTRSEVLKRVGGFPVDQHKGLAAENEYVMALLSVGAVCHVPRTLYFKRIPEKSLVTASRERLLQPLEERLTGWTRHDRRMRSLLQLALDDAGAGPNERDLCGAAMEAAMLERFQNILGPKLSDQEYARAAAALQRLSELDTSHNGKVAANLHLVLSRHWSACGNKQRAHEAERASWEAGDTYGSVLAHARFLFRENRPLEALERAAEAIRIGHLNDTVRAERLIGQIYTRLGWGPPPSD
jgi:hypothetical protein